MSSRALLLAAFGAVAITASVACTTLLGDFEVVQTEADSGTDAGPGKGTVCTTAAECGTGFCVDGVCCEAACDGVCEKCNVPGNEGTCAPVPDGENPDNECPTEALVVPEEDGGTADAGDAGDPDAGPPADAGLAFNLPDGGEVATEQNQCAGSCNGKRACKYPSTERTCGTVVCGNETQQGRASCDGKGHCLFGIETCQAYTCPDGNPGCKATCAGPSDCQDTHFCDGATSTCKPRLNNGVTCANGAQCQTGYCVDGVCCSDACSGFAGATCAKPGSVGTCACTACATGPCSLYYRDSDSDGYGDKNGTIINGNAQPACAAGPAPSGFVANNDDCFDSPGVGANVHPGQTAFFNAPYGPSNSFDYNCDDTVTKETPEFIGESCAFCGIDKFSFRCSHTATTCSSTQVGREASLGCYFGKLTCTPNTTPGFTSAVNCGSSAFRTTCGTCNGSGISGNTGSTVQQRCH